MPCGVTPSAVTLYRTGKDPMATGEHPAPGPGGIRYSYPCCLRAKRSHPALSGTVPAGDGGGDVNGGAVVGLCMYSTNAHLARIVSGHQADKPIPHDPFGAANRMATYTGPSLAGRAFGGGVFAAYEAMLDGEDGTAGPPDMPDGVNHIRDARSPFDPQHPMYPALGKLRIEVTIASPGVGVASAELLVGLLDEVVGSPAGVERFMGVAPSESPRENPLFIVVHKAFHTHVTEWRRGLAEARRLGTFLRLRVAPTANVGGRSSGHMGGTVGRREQDRAAEANKASKVTRLHIYRTARMSRIAELTNSMHRTTPILESACRAANRSLPVTTWPLNGGQDSVVHPTDAMHEWDESLVPKGEGAIDLNTASTSLVWLELLADVYTELCYDQKAAAVGHRSKVRLTRRGRGNVNTSSFARDACSLTDAKTITEKIGLRLTEHPGQYQRFPFCLKRPSNELIRRRPDFVQFCVAISIGLTLNTEANSDSDGSD